MDDYSRVWGALLVVILYLVYWYRRPRRLPPGPHGIPFLGFIPFLGHRPAKTVYKRSKNYGKILTIRMGKEDAVFLNDFKSIQKAFVKNGATLSGRRPAPFLEAVLKDDGLAALDYGPKFKAQRKFGSMTLRGFGVGKKQTETVCLEELQYVYEKMRNRNGKPFDMSPLLHNAISNIICGVLRGQRFDCNDKNFLKMMDFITNAFQDPVNAVNNMLKNYEPMLQHIPPISIIHKNFLKTIENVLDWIRDIVDEHERTFDENNVRDFIEAFIVEKRKGKDDSFQNNQLRNYVMDLFVAGTGTTASSLSWNLLCLIHYPGAQKKLREEIIDVVGSSGTISTTNKADMPYTNAFIQELYRFRTLAPLGFPHQATVDTELEEYVIPKGTQIFGNFWAAHNDPDFWKDPQKFIPERFLDEKGNFVNSNHVIPFSVGPRHCLGEQLARTEIFLFLVGLVQKFEFLPDPNGSELPSIDNGVVGIGFIPKPFSIVAKEL